MATYTDNYQFEKPVASDSVNVAVLNRNSDKLDTILHASQVSIADAYDETATYAVGDMVMYEFFLYKCVTAVTVPETWDATKWERAVAAESGSGGGGSSTLAGLSDVTITSPTDGQGLIWDATAGKWVNGAGGGESSYTVISDTTQTTSTWASPITVSCDPLDYDVIIFDISNAGGDKYYCITYPQTMPLDSGDGQTVRNYVLSNSFTCFPARFSNGMGMFTSTNTTLNVNKVTGIKFGGGSAGINYSTTEQDTGLKWVDGSSIYQITYTGLSFSSNSVSDLQDCTGLNIDTLVSIDGVSSNGNIIVDVSRGNVKAQGKVQYDMSTKHLYFYAGEDCPGGIIHVTLRYTKSSAS